MIKRLLVIVAIATCSVIAAACAGGGGGATPCCEATGVTEPPPASFAASAASAYGAEPVYFSDAGCVELSSSSGLVLTGLETAGRARDVESNGRYDVDIAGEATGRQVYVRIFPTANPEITLGIGAIPAAAASNGEGTIYRVAPINFTPGATNLVGESTLELGMFCALGQAGLQNMVLSDVRAAISKPIAQAVNLDDPTTIARARLALTRYRHGVNGVVGIVPAALKQDFERVRDHAQRAVDACRDGNPIESAARIPCSDAPIAEFYRAWVMARADQILNDRAPEHVLAWAFDVEKALVPELAVNDPFAELELRQAWMLRFEASDRALTTAASSLGMQPGAVQVLTSNLEVVRTRILQPATSTVDLANEWQRVGDYLIPILKQGSPQSTEPCDFVFFKGQADQAGRGVFTDFSGIDPSHSDLVNRIFVSTTSLQAANRDRLRLACLSMDEPSEQPILDAWTNIYTHLTINISPIDN